MAFGRVQFCCNCFGKLSEGCRISGATDSPCKGMDTFVTHGTKVHLLNKAACVTETSCIRWNWLRSSFLLGCSSWCHQKKRWNEDTWLEVVFHIFTFLFQYTTFSFPFSFFSFFFFARALYCTMPSLRPVVVLYSHKLGYNLEIS